MNADEILLETEEAMQKAVDYVLHEMSTVRTGKASPSLIEGIEVHVQAYGSNMRLKQLALISTPEPRLLTVSPYDPGTLKDIERALRESRLGITPSMDGKLIRLPIPELSEERRKELVKLMRDMSEQGKVRVRSARRDGMENLKSAQKNGEITEDDLHRNEKEVQTLTDKYVASIDEHAAHKEKEIMTV
ncbi:MAG: ribosome recycling factor [Verrucomicrobiales bacterium]|nr:ribosome recycling factor [Verrucomicrobiae bacterium]MCP5552250.1 ribosome recycling factor [Akkermansiaceae bacterium]HRX56976.1 ribosome recycling factor [Verrucomicrobiales bacterium]